MKIDLTPGKYVVAVSGGVDSMVLLHLLQSRPELELIVAHFDHGIREDSAADAEFVQMAAAGYGLAYIAGEGRLGPAASEAQARAARYRFLRQAKAQISADAIVTAHHLNDVLETALLNIVRGTGRRGLTSLRSTPEIQRPLLQIPKFVLLQYAKNNQLMWQEDSTNRDDSYRRNQIRHHVMTKFTENDKQKLHEIIVKTAFTNDEIDSELAKLLDALRTPDGIDRMAFIHLPHAVALEVMALWLRESGPTHYDRQLLERLVWAAKILSPGQRMSIRKNQWLQLTRSSLALVHTER